MPKKCLLLVLLFPVVFCWVSFGQTRTYTKTQVSSGTFDHESPSINNRGDIVWSQQNAGVWQIYLLPAGAPASAVALLPGQRATDNNQFPSIDDAGDVLYSHYLGKGTAVVLNHGGIESTIQFTTINTQSGQERKAGPYSGISSNGTTITYFDFLTFGFGPRIFVVSNVGQLDSDFSGADFPDVNSNGTFVYSADGQIFSAPATDPNTVTSVASGDVPRIADIVPPATTPEIVYISGGTQVVSTIGGTIDAGVSADVNNSGTVVYEKAVDGINQVFMATTGCQPNSDKPCIATPKDGAEPQSQFVALSGTGKAGDSLDVLVTGVPVGSVIVDSEGKWEALPYISPFGSSPMIHVQDQTTFDTSNTITVHPRTSGLPRGPLTSFTRLLPLRHADIFVDADPSSGQVVLYGPTYTHTALYLGGDADGTPWLAEAVTADEAGIWGQVRSLPLEQSLVWTSLRVSGFTPISPLAGATRDAIVAWASNITKQGLPYWSKTKDLLGPMVAADALYIASGGLIKTRFTSLLNLLDTNKNSTSKFICSTLVWRAYYEGTGHTLDISSPNLMSALPGSSLGNLPTLLREPFIDDLRPVFVVPETFVRSPKLKQIF